MWNEQKIERHLHDCLVNEYGKDQGEVHYTNYTSARNYLVTEVLPEIKGSEPTLTDHSDLHIANVLQNIWHLIGEGHHFTAIELYCLCLVAIFHDVGNVKGRKEHNKKISEVYNAVRNNNAKFNQERTIVLIAARAHCGTSLDGGADTLKDLDELSHLNGESIRLRELASIIRLADELAEGPQRTSDFMTKSQSYKADSEIYHAYANITNIWIDRGNGRIAITYNIDITSESTDQWIEHILTFSYQRILKLEEERKYAKYYSITLLPFQKTEATFNFFINGNPANLDIPKIELKDCCPIPSSEPIDGNVLIGDYSALDYSCIIKKISELRNG